MKPYSSVFIYLGNCGKLGSSSYHSTDTQKVIHSAKLLISHQMKPYSSVKGHPTVNLYFFVCICGIGASWQNLTQLPKIMGRGTQKVIQSVEFFISHQMKPYSRVKTICGSSYTYFGIFEDWGKSGKLGPNTAHHEH